MDSLSAFARGEAARHNRVKVFDWCKAARLIRDHKPSHAHAGLQGDWECTGGLIYTADGIPNEKDTYVYLSSTWAYPELDMGDEYIECWTWADETGWGARTYWPPEALKILRGEE